MTFKFIRSASAVAALVATSLAAQAADLPTSYKAPQYQAPAYMSWTGFYLGINGGYGFGSSTVSNNVGSTSFSPKGGLAGVTLGYNFQTGTWVWGAEGDIDWSGVKGTSTSFCAPGACTVSNRWLSTVRGRLGYAGWNNWLPYVTGGAAIGGLKFEQNGGGDSKTRIGWTLGLGVEYALMTNWSVKLEYLYADLGTATCAAGTTCNPTQDVKYSFKENIVRAGVNYRF